MISLLTLKIVRLFSVASIFFLIACAGNYRFNERVSEHSPPQDILKLRWKKQLVVSEEILNYGPLEWASAAIDPKGAIYIGSSAKRFFAIDPNGHVLWKLETIGAISSQPWYSEQMETVYFGADDGHMYAVDAKTGKVRWKYKTQGIINHAPVFSEGLLLFTTSQDRIYALDARSGHWRWQYDREIPEGFTIHGYSGVLAHKGIAYVGFSDGMVVALRSSSGDVVWTRSLASGETRFVDVDATPVLIGDMLVTASYATGVYALLLSDGTIRWNTSVKGTFAVAAYETRIYVASSEAGILALDRDGREIWRQSIPKGVSSKPIVVGPYLMASGTESGLNIASAQTGELLQYFDPGKGISACPAFGADTLVVLSNRGVLYAFDLEE